MPTFRVDGLDKGTGAHKSVDVEAGNAEEAIHWACQLHEMVAQEPAEYVPRYGRLRALSWFYLVLGVLCLIVGVILLFVGFKGSSSSSRADRAANYPALIIGAWLGLASLPLFLVSYWVELAVNVARDVRLMRDKTVGTKTAPGEPRPKWLDDLDDAAEGTKTAPGEPRPKG